ncbi:MAG TPA: CRTAC1 family protein [Planctomycetaceae bacterium]|nr:CRTAC1 family protein [Planctomycetaceae bacterium]
MSTQDTPQEERDDAVIGTALRRSFLVIGVVGAIAAAAIVGPRFWTKPPEKIIAAPVEPPQPRKELARELPPMPFTDITQSAGITFRHENGATEEKLLPETMGGGCAFFDYDSDGDQDLFFVNSTRWPWDQRPTTAKPPTMALYANDGKGHFTDVTSDTGLAVTFYGQGVAAGDYDNDGDADLFISAVGLNHLYRNDGGKFVDVTEELGIAGQADQWSTSCGWFDYDRDGDLDLFVSNYVMWTRQFDIEQNFQLTGGGRAYGRPQNFPGTFPYLYRNDGGKFTNVAEAAGLHVKNPATGVPSAKSLGVTFVDGNRDGYLDIVVANDTVQNFYFENQKDGTFNEIASLAGVAYDNDGNARGAMGIDAAYFRNSRQLGIAIGNFSNEMTALYVSQGDTAQFVDEAVATGLGPQSRLELKFGTLFADIDLDGRLDLIGANGHLEQEINRVQPSQYYEQPPHFFYNCGPLETTEFRPVPSSNVGTDYTKRMVGRGAAVADIDGDGDLDVVFAASGQAPRLLRNDQKLGHHWLRLKLTGTNSPKDAIGAVVSFKLGSEQQTAMVMPTRSYLSQCERIITLGLGASKEKPALTIRWPSGTEQTLAEAPLDQLLEITEP